MGVDCSLEENLISASAHILKIPPSPPPPTQKKARKESNTTQHHKENKTNTRAPSAHVPKTSGKGGGGQTKIDPLPPRAFSRLRANTSFASGSLRRVAAEAGGPEDPRLQGVQPLAPRTRSWVAGASSRVDGDRAVGVRGTRPKRTTKPRELKLPELAGETRGLRYWKIFR